MTRHASRGQATILMIGGLAGLLIATVIIGAVARAVGREGAAQRAADLAAVAAARVMHDNYGRLFEPALIRRRPNPNHLEKADYLALGRAAGQRVARANGASRVTVGFPDEATIAPVRVRVGIRATLRKDQAVDVVAEYGVRADAAEWAGVLGRLQPRLYSISSSPLTDPRLIALTVSVVRYEGPGGRPRGGVCSAFLADAEPGTTVPVQVRRAAHFKPPSDPAAPMVMVGPGTGVAPFLGFLDDRRARGHRGPNWLFFGEQHRATDFYHRDDLAARLADGSLTRLDTAFSRDQRAKVYVQDRMREHGPLLWSWLQDGAHFYVCGDAARMAKDVDRALHAIATTYGGLSPEAAASYVKQLAADKRYVRDVY